MPITTMKCGKCGGEMSLNPHPSAGNPDLYIEVGCQFECIPCLVKGRHELAVRGGNCKSNPGMACVATVSCYKENFLKNHSCGGCCKEYIESLKINPSDEYKIKKAASL